MLAWKYTQKVFMINWYNVGQFLVLISNFEEK